MLIYIDSPQRLIGDEITFYILRGRTMVILAGPRYMQSSRHISKASSAVAILVGVLVLAGWAFDIAALKSVLPGLVTMKANTALAFLLTGVSLFLLQSETVDRWPRRISLACACASALLGLLVLSEYFWIWDLNVDQILFKDVQTTPVPPGRMAISTAFNFLVIGIALLLLADARRKNVLIAQLLSLCTTLLSFLSLLGYAYGVKSLYDFGPFSAMALHTAAIFALLSVGVVFARPDKGIMAIVTSRYAVGGMVRRLLPAVIGVPLVLGWLILLGQQVDFYSPPFGLALFTALSALVLAVLVSIYASSLNRTDILRVRAEEEIQRSTQTLSALVQASPVAIVAVDRDRNVTIWNPAAERVFGWKESEVLGRPFPIIPEGEHDAFLEYFEQGMRGVIYSDVERSLLRCDGTLVEVSLSRAPLRDATGNIVGLVTLLSDISDRKQAEQQLKASMDKLSKALEDTVQAMSLTVELRDPYTAGHERRVADLAVAIAETLGLPDQQIKGIRTAGLLHDIGKIALPADILSKPGRLTPGEFNLVKTHSETGHNILRTVEFPWPVAVAVLQHHERIDGSGYPNGTKNGEILLEARILAVADVVEAMSSHRPYRPALAISEALREIKENSSTAFDADVVEACLSLFEQHGFAFEQ